MQAWMAAHTATEQRGLCHRQAPQPLAPFAAPAKAVSTCPGVNASGETPALASPGGAAAGSLG